MIIKSPINALHNVTNPYQGTEKRVLCLCSAGLLRSVRLAQILQTNYNFNTRAAGVADYALIPISTALLEWADEIVCVELEIERQLMSDVVNTYDAQSPKIYAIRDKIITLDVPDIYGRMDYELQEIILQQYKEKLIG